MRLLFSLQIVECVLSHNGNVLVEVFLVTSFVGVGVPVVATRTDADDAALGVRNASN